VIVNIVLYHIFLDTSGLSNGGCITILPSPSLGIRHKFPAIFTVRLIHAQDTSGKAD